jgi:hypothetical protein
MFSLVGFLISLEDLIGNSNKEVNQEPRTSEFKKPVADANA